MKNFLNIDNWHLIDDAMDLNFPHGSKITKIYTQVDDNNSMWACIEHEVSEEHAVENELWYKHRILYIRIGKGENDQRSPIYSCANTEKGMRKV